MCNCVKAAAKAAFNELPDDKKQAIRLIVRSCETSPDDITCKGKRVLLSEIEALAPDSQSQINFPCAPEDEGNFLRGLDDITPLRDRVKRNKSLFFGLGYQRAPSSNTTVAAIPF
jgi:hypothetical protein